MPSSQADKRTLAEANFDPIPDQIDGEVITANVTPAKDKNNSDNVISLPAKQATAKQAYEYFSVQVFASKSNSDARDYKNSISSLFDEEVRIDYQAPYYKVCIGKNASFENAEGLLKKVHGLGFPQAWLVRERK